MKHLRNRVSGKLLCELKGKPTSTNYSLVGTQLGLPEPMCPRCEDKNA